MCFMKYFSIDNQLDIVIAFMTLNVKLNVKPFTGGNIQLRFKNDIFFKFEERVMYSVLINLCTSITLYFLLT